MAEQAEGNAVERAARRLLSEVCDRPAADTAVEVPACVGLVAGLGAVARPAADVQAPAEDEFSLRTMRARGRLEEAVRLLDRDWLVTGLAGVDVANIYDAPPPDQLASAARQHGDVVAVVDVVTVEDGPPRQGKGEVARRLVADAPIGQQLVSAARVGDVAEQVRALLGDRPHGLDDDRQGMAREHELGSALKEIAGHFGAQLELDSIDLPRLVVLEVGRKDIPVNPGIAQLAVHQGPGCAVHPDQAVPHVPALHKRRDPVRGEDGVAERILG